jgi:hypothetical protein
LRQPRAMLPVFEDLLGSHAERLIVSYQSYALYD